MSAYILPYSVEAYKDYYTEEFMTGFTHRSLAAGQCDPLRSREIVKLLNAKAAQIQPTISFNEEMLTSDQLVGGACSALAFRVGREALKINASLKGSGLSPMNQERSFIFQLIRFIQGLEQAATSQKAADKGLQSAIRTEQLALNTITVNRDEIKTGDAVSEKIQAMSPFYGLDSVESTSEIRVKGNEMLKEELEETLSELGEGVFFMRIIQEKYNHKLEEKGHSMILINKAGSQYYFDPALGAYALFSETKKNSLIYESLQSANIRHGVDLLSFHRLEEAYPIASETFFIKDPALEGTIDFPASAHEKNPYPIVIFSPGLGVSIEAYKEIAHGLCREGFCVVRVTHPKTGVGVARLEEGRIIELGFENSVHIEKLIDLIRKGAFKTLSPENPIGVMGHSLGGSASVEACRHSPHIRAVVNFDGRILEPTGVAQPVLHFEAAAVKEDRSEYTRALESLMDANPRVSLSKFTGKHSDFSSPDPKFLSCILEASSLFFKHYLTEEEI